MITFEGNIPEFKDHKEPIALTIGVFDGVHRGHVDLIKQLLKKASQLNLKTGILSFYPHPNQVLGVKPYLGDILCKNERIEKIEKLGVDFLFLQDFSLKFSEISREDFLRQYLQNCIVPDFLLFGYDFRFGQGGLGHYEYAKKALFPTPVEQAAPLDQEGEVISSSKIRSFLMQSQIKKANNFLGYLFKISGKVQKGVQLGRTLGFPTANLDEIHTIVPGQGVYAGFVEIDKKKYQAVMNIGLKPTVQNDDKISCECHIINFSGDLYGRVLAFEFVEFIRAERKFLSLDELKNQIQQDVIAAKSYLEMYESGS